MTDSGEMEWQVEPLAQHLDDETILTAVRESLPGGAATRKTADYWRWKHVENIFGTSIGTFGKSRCSGEIVGVRPLMRWRFRQPSEAVWPAVRAVDTVTSPDWRGRGVFKALTHSALSLLKDEGVALIFNTPNRSSAPGYLKMGWTEVGVVPLYIRPQKPMAMILDVLRHRRRAELTPRPGDFGVEDFPTWAELVRLPDCAELVESHEKARVATGLRTPRSAEYLAWRYGRNPQVEYRVYVLREGGEASALAVLRSNIRFGMRELVVTELWAKEARPDLMRQCLQSLAREVDAHYLVGHFSTGSRELAALRGACFFKVPKQGMRLFVKAVEASVPASMLQLPAWDLSLGDLELF